MYAIATRNDGDLWYYTGNGRLSRRPEDARKFTLPADAECRLESIGYGRNRPNAIVIVPVGEATEPIRA